MTPSPRPRKAPRFRHGGRRRGAGRKRVAPRPLVPHRRRPSHDPANAMHMTVRRRANLPSFRRQRVLDLVHDLMRKKNDDSFQIVHYSIQSNHIHLVCEARDRRAVTRKMQGFMIAFAKRLNAMLGNRRGKVWADRYFARDVVDSRDMHNVLSYVFGNAKKHGASESMFDLFASGWAFPGWDVRLLTYGLDHFPRPKPRTAMLDRWWKLHGPVRSTSERASDARTPPSWRSLRP